MKILFVAMPFSIHTARWITQLVGEGFDVHFFSSMRGHDLHESIRGITFHENIFETGRIASAHNNYRTVTLPSLSFIKNPVLKKVIRKSVEAGIKPSKLKSLQKVIQTIKPDIIHSLETQHAGYMVAEAKTNSNKKFPLWIHSCWGIDLHFFGQLQQHIPLIKKTLSQIDVFITEGKRDEKLAREFGFSGTIYTFPSVGGGFVIPQLQDNKPSLRKKILLKGAQDIVRRGLVGLRALERCVDILGDFEIVMYSSNEITQAAAESFYYRTNKKVTVLDHISHEEMMLLNREARLNICINMSDGLPNSMLEAMLTGAFPIQSNTSMADEWIVHEKTGMIVPPEDPDIIELAIRKAISDDSMVDNAPAVNYLLLKEKLEYKHIQQEVIKMYQECSIKKSKHLC